MNVASITEAAMIQGLARGRHASLAPVLRFGPSNRARRLSERTREEEAMDSRWIVVAVIVVVAVAVVLLVRRRRSTALREQFGPEYGHAVRKYGSVTRAEDELEARRRRVRRLTIEPLRPEDAARFAEAWRHTQARFVDDPARAVGDGDRLVQDLMQTRGYPVGNFEERVADISVDHPRVVEHYRAAHAIAQTTADGRTDTEDLRQAMVHLRALFEDLLEVRDDAPRDEDPPRRAEGGRR
jgi:hypothetical protein